MKLQSYARKLEKKIEERNKNINTMINNLEQGFLTFGENGVVDSGASKFSLEIKNVQLAAINNNNMFEKLMEACKYASLGQITNALFEVGGQYRRNM